MFAEEPAPEPPSREPRRRSGAGRRAARPRERILVAMPWIVFAIAIVVAGGVVFALAMIAIGLALPARVLP